MTDHLPYIPDIDRLLNTLRKISGSRPEEWEGDSYVSFWTGVNAIQEKNSEYTVNSSFTTMLSEDKSEASNAFWSWISL